MTTARNTQISLDDSTWYHCVARCVRRAYLCGNDFHSDKNFDHRRGWIRDRILELANIFAMDVAAYAVMSNHYHVVVHVDRDRAELWSDEEVFRRWRMLFTGPALLNRYLSDDRKEMSESELNAVTEMVSQYRERLYDLSWFMRCLNEFIAREANAEDGVKGRFWEGRFKTQVLLDEQALLAAMTYVDLNPVRAGIADTPEASEYTSIAERVADSQIKITKEDLEEEAPPAKAPLMPFSGNGQVEWAIPFAYQDYLELIDWTGRAVHPMKRGFIPSDMPSILVRFGFNGEEFIKYSHRMLKEFSIAVGKPASLGEYCARKEVKYLRGISASRKMLADAA